MQQILRLLSHQFHMRIKSSNAYLSLLNKSWCLRLYSMYNSCHVLDAVSVCCCSGSFLSQKTVLKQVSIRCLSNLQRITMASSFSTQLLPLIFFFNANFYQHNKQEQQNMFVLQSSLHSCFDSCLLLQCCSEHTKLLSHDIVFRQVILDSHY